MKINLLVLFIIHGPIFWAEQFSALSKHETISLGWDANMKYMWCICYIERFAVLRNSAGCYLFPHSRVLHRWGSAKIRGCTLALAFIWIMHPFIVLVIWGCTLSPLQFMHTNDKEFKKQLKGFWFWFLFLWCLMCYQMQTLSTGLITQKLSEMYL